MKVIIGAGGTEQTGWVSLQEKELDITDADSWARRFKPRSLEAICAEHVWEHLTLEEGLAAAILCYHYLQPGGSLRIAVPDGFHPSKRYIEWVRPGTGFNGTDHKVLYNYKLLADLLQQAGFKIILREWCDETGRLHFTPLDKKYGYIKRSIRSFWAWVQSLLVGARYTSLIVGSTRQHWQLRQNAAGADVARAHVCFPDDGIYAGRWQRGWLRRS